MDADWVIGCDGAHSTVRHLNHQHFPGEAERATYIIADVALDGNVPRDEIVMALSTKGMFFGFPLPNGRFLLNGDRPPDDTRSELAAMDLQALVDERSGLAATVRDVTWTSTYQVHYRLTPHYRHGRTFLAGDAAHIHSPVGGRGMNSGIHDAQNLAWKLALVVEGKAPALLLDTYESERRPEALYNTTSSKVMSASIGNYQRLSDSERANLVKVMTLAKTADEQITAQRHSLGVDAIYPHSVACRQSVRELSKHTVFCAGPEPGAIATGPEDLTCAGARVFFDDILNGPKFTLLGFAGTNHARHGNGELRELLDAFAARFEGLLNAYLVVPGPPAERNGEVATLVDVNAVLHARFGCEDAGLYLIRPDGHVGFRNQPPSVVALRSYMDRVLSCTSGTG